MPRIKAFLLFALAAAPANAFVPLSSPAKPFQQQYQNQKVAARFNAPTLASPTALAVSAPDIMADGSLSQSLVKLLLETMIVNGVPAVFTIVVIGFAALQFRPRKGDDGEDGEGSGLRDRFGKKNNPAAELYSDLYEGDEMSKPMSPFAFLKAFKGDSATPAAVNRGVPALQYIDIKNVNKKYDSYEYTVTAATESKAKAAADYRAKNFERALKLSLNPMSGEHSDGRELSAFAKTTLLALEKQFLKDGSKFLNEVQTAQAELTKTAIDEEMEAMGVDVYELDPQFPNATAANETGAEMRPDSWGNKGGPSKRQQKAGAKNTEAIFNKLTKAQKDLMKVEMDFVKDVVATLGSERATGMRTALLGDIAARGTGGLLTQMKERPLSALLQGISTGKDATDAVGSKKGSLFVTKFPGDVQASQVAELREEVTAIVRSAKPGDEALVVLQSGGGTVTGYGLAAAQLLRFKEAGMKLTIVVEQVAASGGYMMCCVADKIVSSPFAVLGSIGVITDIPNVYDRLKKEGIEFQTVTAGKYKRTITPTKRVTKEDFDKTKEDVEGILTLFKQFVHQNRPSLDIDDVATGTSSPRSNLACKYVFCCCYDDKST